MNSTNTSTNPFDWPEESDTHIKSIDENNSWSLRTRNKYQTPTSQQEFTRSGSYEEQYSPVHKSHHQDNNPFNQSNESSSFANTTPRTSDIENGTVRDNSESLYHLNSLSQVWLLLAMIIHIIQWGLLLKLVQDVISSFLFGVLFILFFIVLFTLALTRFLIKKRKMEIRLVHTGDGHVKQELLPEDETDYVPNSVIALLMIAAIIEGFLFALFSAVVAGKDSSKFIESGYGSQDSLLEILRFASITFLAIHRIIRPANRIDPMRTILELEVVSVCWDALDGSTLYQLLNDLPMLNDELILSIRFLMAFWYISVGVRIALMFSTHLPPDAMLYKWVLYPPHHFAENPTVDRSLSAIRLRCIIIVCMGGSELYAAGVRVYIWSLGLLDTMQIEMFFKNLLFLASVVSLYGTWKRTSTREWNTRELMFGMKVPIRPTQLELYRYTFALLYLLQGSFLTAILMNYAEGGKYWVLNSLTDITLLIFFLYYCRNCHRQQVNEFPRFFLFQQGGFMAFPSKLALWISIALAVNMFFCRIPGIYFTATSLENAHITDIDTIYTYGHALLIVNMSVLTIGSIAMFWSISYLLFHKDFTACLDKYHAIHDPITSMVATSTMIEGALDILSCTSLMTLATYDLPFLVHWWIAISAGLECLNACQCFALQALLSGGKNDSPFDLVRWKAYLRAARFTIDLLVTILRIVLWVKYNAVSSVFLIKNIYNLIHTVTMVERYIGGRHYPNGALFAKEVRPAEWYGMTDQEWKTAVADSHSPLNLK